jgi:cytoplasmic iron level regulating protein YaaA (DUF328/UPF0246 family)
MKILISPAKSIDTNVDIDVPQTTTAQFLKEADLLMRKLSKLSADKLMKLMHISQDIAAMNVNRNKNWTIPTTQTDVIKPAVTVFTGEVYRGLDVQSFTQDDFIYANNHLRILSGLYGVLRPLDLMYPYRLEMGTKWEITPKIKNIYAFWGIKINKALSDEMKTDEAIINLASTEYFKAVQHKKLKNKIITPIFKDFKNGDYKVIMMYAKNARGQMANFIIKNKLTDPEDLKAFERGGYRFDVNLSSEDEWVFTR